MTVPSNQPRCGVCNRKLVKNGTTSAGRTRWRCKFCGASGVQARHDVTRKAEFDVFFNWVTGTTRQGTSQMSERTFRRRVAWCWTIDPRPAPTGQIYPQLMLDGTYFNGWCVLVAYTGSFVVDWQWCDREKHASWSALLQRLPAPGVAVVDGHRGLASAMAEHWAATKVQRCLFHIRHGAHRHLTRRPNLPAAKQLLALVKALTEVKNLDQAAAWMGQYATWESSWRSFLNQRTYARSGVTRPTHVRGNQKWWFTHLRLRRARGLISTVVSAGHLFTWLEQAHPERAIARTTSPLEGGINAGIKNLLRAHRGLTEDHARRAVDWYLYTHTENPKAPWGLVRPTHWQPTPRRKKVVTPEPIGPAEYDTGLSAEEGLWTRKG